MSESNMRRLGWVSLAGGVISACLGAERLMDFLLVAAVIYSCSAVIIQKLDAIAGNLK